METCQENPQEIQCPVMKGGEKYSAEPVIE